MRTRAAGPSAYLDSELQLLSPRRARFSCGGRVYSGEIALVDELRQHLDALVLDPAGYGRELHRAVFPPASLLRDGLREAAVAAEQGDRRLRFRLLLDGDLPEWIHALYWELLLDAERRVALARSPDTAFSRYCGVPREPGRTTTRRPRLLCAVAAPSNAERYGLAEIERAEVLRRFQGSLAPLARVLDVEVLEPPTTPGRLRQRLTEEDFHLLHLFGHGQVQGRDGAALVLESDEGTARFVGEELLAEVFLGDRGLRLVTLVACHGGAPSSRDAFSGLAGRLVERGLPAVVAMRRAVTFEMGYVFSEHFYRHLAHCARVDAAVNEARHQLYLAEGRGLAWSSPVLYMRLADGLLWKPRQGRGEPHGSGKETPASPLRRPWPWLPALFFVLAAAASLWPLSVAEADLDLEATGLRFRLAENHGVFGELHLDELATTGLAALRLVDESRVEGDADTMLGVLARPTLDADPPASLTLQMPVLPAAARVGIEHLEERAYRLAVNEAEIVTEVSLLGEIFFKRLDRPERMLHLEQPGPLLLYPRGGDFDLELSLAKFDGEEFQPNVPVDHLTFLEIVENHGTEQTTLDERSTLLGGEAALLSTGRVHPLRQGDELRFTVVEGSLDQIRLGAEGIGVSFRGQVSGLQRVSPGLPPELLMPSLLDLWLQGRAQQAALGLLATLALCTPFLAFRQARQTAGRHLSAAADSRSLATPYQGGPHVS